MVEVFRGLSGGDLTRLRRKAGKNLWAGRDKIVTRIVTAKEVVFVTDFNST